MSVFSDFIINIKLVPEFLSPAYKAQIIHQHEKIIKLLTIFYGEMIISQKNQTAESNGLEVDKNNNQIKQNAVEILLDLKRTGIFPFIIPQIA